MYYNKNIWNIIKNIYTYKKTKISLKNTFCKTTGTNIPKILKDLNNVNIHRGKSIKEIRSFQQLFGMRLKYLNKNGPKN